MDSFDIEINGNDTILIDYISLNIQESNINTKSGPIHFISEVMELYQPGRSTRVFQFLEDPVIAEAEASPGRYEFVDPERFEMLYWEGPENIVYTKLSGNSGVQLNKDYLVIEGSFVIQYQTPKILPGAYRLELGVERRNESNATVQVFIDERRLGSSFNLTKGGTNSEPYLPLDLGVVEFDAYTGHTIVIKSLIPGVLNWDYVRFIPE